MLFAGAVVFYIVTGLVPGWRKVVDSTAARDYATYHYAVQEAVDGGDPYDTKALSARARTEGTRRSVHPYFYPPPFLGAMLWAAPLSLATGYRIFFGLNQLLLLAATWTMRRWVHGTWLPIAVAALTLSPIADSNVMGQANLMVLVLVILGLSTRNGKLVGVAAMFKMSPALYLAAWVARGHWGQVVFAGVTAIALTVLALPLVDGSAQLRFYTEILPGFSSGEYHGLRVPITLPGNHSIPDLFNQALPGPDTHHLSTAARVGAQAVSLGLLAVLTGLSRKIQRDDSLGNALIMGAFTALLTLTPVYTYEHHFAMLFLPGAALFVALDRGRLGPRWWAVVGPAWFAVAWKLGWLRGLQELVPALDWVLQESKFVGAVALGVACVVAALQPVDRPETDKEDPIAQQQRMARELERVQAEQQARQAEQRREQQAHQQSLFPKDIRERGTE